MRGLIALIALSAMLLGIVPFAAAGRDYIEGPREEFPPTYVRVQDSQAGNTINWDDEHERVVR